MSQRIPSSMLTRLCPRCAQRHAFRSISSSAFPRQKPLRSPALVQPSNHRPFLPLSSPSHLVLHRNYASPTPADTALELLNDLYGTARDEFEIAAEETEKKTVYAADDRQAAAEALEEFKEAYEKAVRESSPEVGKEIQGRVGQRLRELQTAVRNLEESATEG